MNREEAEVNRRRHSRDCCYNLWYAHRMWTTNACGRRAAERSSHVTVTLRTAHRTFPTLISGAAARTCNWFYLSMANISSEVSIFYQNSHNMSRFPSHSSVGGSHIHHTHITRPSAVGSRHRSVIVVRHLLCLLCLPACVPVCMYWISSLKIIHTNHLESRV